MNAGQKTNQKRQKRRAGLVAFAGVPETFMARDLSNNYKQVPRQSFSGLLCE